MDQNVLCSLKENELATVKRCIFYILFLDLDLEPFFVADNRFKLHLFFCRHL